jgi:hypothetical protein
MRHATWGGALLAALSLLGGCSEERGANGPQRRDAAVADGMDAGVRRDGGLPMDGAAPDGTGTDGGDDAATRMDATARMDAAPDGGLDGGDGWPERALLSLSLDALISADCRIALDRGDDGEVDERWGYEYGDDGRLVRLLHWRSTFRDPRPRVVVFDDDGQPTVTCAPEGCRRFEPLVDARSETLRSPLYTEPGEAPDDTDTITVGIDPDAGFRAWSRDIDLWSQTDQYTWIEGVLRTHSYSNDDFEYRVEYQADGGVQALRLLDGDDEDFSFECDSAGWETAYVRDRSGVGDEVSWSTRYMRQDGRVIRSETEYVPNEYWEQEPSTLTVDYDYDDDAGVVMEHAVDPAVELDRTRVRELAELVSTPRFTANGNLSAIEHTRGGETVSVDTYRYGGEGPCREGQNPQLERPITLAPDAPPLSRCPHTPMDADTQRLYGLDPYELD